MYNWHILISWNPYFIQISLFVPKIFFCPRIQDTIQCLVVTFPDLSLCNSCFPQPDLPHSRLLEQLQPWVRRYLSCSTPAGRSLHLKSHLHQVDRTHTKSSCCGSKSDLQYRLSMVFCPSNDFYEPDNFLLFIWPRVKHILLNFDFYTHAQFMTFLECHVLKKWSCPQTYLCSVPLILNLDFCFNPIQGLY